MILVGQRKITKFIRKHPNAKASLERWVVLITENDFDSFPHLQQFPIKHTTKKLSQRLKVETTMLEPIKSIFISNGVDRISNSFVKSLDCSSFSRTNNFF